MILKNKEIYRLTKQLSEAFENKNQELPIKLNFIIQKNKKLLLNLSAEIEEARLKVLSKYGTLDQKKNIYNFQEQDIDTVNSELEELLNIEQDINLLMIKIKDIEKYDIDLSIDQMDAIMFMIEENEKKKEE